MANRRLVRLSFNLVGARPQPPAVPERFLREPPSGVCDVFSDDSLRWHATQDLG